MKIFISLASNNPHNPKTVAKRRAIHEARKNNLIDEIENYEVMKSNYYDQLKLYEIIRDSREEIGYGDLKKTGRALAKQLGLPPKMMAVYETEASIKRNIAMYRSLLAGAESDLKKAANKLAKLEAKG